MIFVHMQEFMIMNEVLVNKSSPSQQKVVVSARALKNPNFNHKSSKNCIIFFHLAKKKKKKKELYFFFNMHGL